MLRIYFWQIRKIDADFVQFAKMEADEGSGTLLRGPHPALQNEKRRQSWGRGPQAYMKQRQ